MFTWLRNAGLVAAVCLVTFGAGYYMGAKTPAQVVVQTKTEVKEVEVEKLVTKTVTVTAKAPDGTKTTTKTVETTQNTEKVTKEKSNAEQPVPQGSQVDLRPDYSVGVTWTPRLSEDVYQPTGLELGYRAIGNAWVTGGYDWYSKQATVGVRIDF